MKRILIFILAFSSCAFAQEGVKTMIFQSQGAVSMSGTAASVQGAPYSATITNESVQTMADGNRIVQTSSGTIARDSQGRTRQDTALPAIGTLSAGNEPHIVFILDPVAQVSYTLNLADKTAQKMTMPPPAAGGPGGPAVAARANTFFLQMGPGPATAGALPPPAMAIQGQVMVNDQAQATTEDLGSETREGLLVNGTRTTRTIPAGQIGNDKPISIVTEVWTSPDLKTIVYSKRSDPRMGEQTFQLTNINRSEPDPSLFTVPADFKVVDGPQPILYRSNQ
jgi:hypothetical protein